MSGSDLVRRTSWRPSPARALIVQAVVLNRDGLRVSVETARARIERDDLIIADRPIVGLAFGAFTDALDRAAADACAPSVHQLTLKPSPGHPVGVREFVNDEEGEGYWDLFRINDELTLSITDARYRRAPWISVEGGHFFKIRLLLSGRLLGPLGDTTLQGPQAQLHVCPGEAGGGYRIAPDLETRMVVLHCHPDLLSRRLGLSSDDIPAPFDLLSSGVANRSVAQRIGFGPELLRPAQSILDSRRDVPRALRAAYLEALAMEVLCQILAELSNRQLVDRAARRLGSRDLNSIYEARDYLSQHYAAPPTIPQLARMVGVNQTKLKAGFKQALNLTLYEYVLQRRMEVAAELLAKRDLSIAEIAYQVGYEYPANFSCAFKRYYGQLPRAWKWA